MVSKLVGVVTRARTQVAKLGSSVKRARSNVVSALGLGIVAFGIGFRWEWLGIVAVGVFVAVLGIALDEDGTP